MRPDSKGPQKWFIGVVCNLALRISQFLNTRRQVIPIFGVQHIPQAL
ncbi:uncharacterized protein METZ01_LOCUS353140, partial [marine metagenome]